MFNFLMSNNEKCKECESVGRRITEEMFGDKINFCFTKEQYNRIDFIATSKKGKKNYIGEIKCYRNPEYPRYHDKFNNYQIDYDKLFELSQKAELNNSTPLIIVHFTDVTIVWDLTKCNWKDSGKWVMCNKTGVDYGDKVWKYEGYLRLEEGIKFKV